MGCHSILTGPIVGKTWVVFKLVCEPKPGLSVSIIPFSSRTSSKASKGQTSTVGVGVTVGVTVGVGVGVNVGVRVGVVVTIMVGVTVGVVVGVT